MARIRSVKPEFWLDRKLARGLSLAARLLYIGLWNYADEHGRLHGDPAVIKGQVFPYDDVSVEGLLDELKALGRVQRYWFDGDPYLFLPKLAKHQRLEPTKATSRLPEPPDSPEPSTPSRSEQHSEKIVAESEPTAAESETKNASLCSREHVAGSMEHGCRETLRADKPAPKRGTRIPEPFELTDQMRDWARLKAPAVHVFDELEQFSDYHHGKGTVAKDWEATWRTWMRNAQKWSKRPNANALAEKRDRALSVIRNTAPLREIS